MPEPRLTALNVTAHPSGAWQVGLIAKRTYLVAGERCVPAEEQVALVEGPQASEDAAELVHDSDLVLNRTQVDVIVLGHAYPPRPEATAFDVRVRVGDLDRTARARGDRRCGRDAAGRLLFTTPGRVEKIPLGWASAYGGVDRASLAKYGDPMREVAGAMGQTYDPRFGLHAYPRNPLGKGYVTEATAEAVEECRLPNLEEPLRELTPETLALGEFTRWPGGPPVASFGWLSYNYFPRSAMAGMAPIPYDDAAHPPAQFFEVKLGAVREDTVAPDTAFARRLDLAVAQGSAVGMRAARVAAGEPIELVNLHPRRPTARFQLPSEVPRMALQMPDEKPVEPTPAIRTVLIEPDRDRVCLVWVATHRQSQPVGPNKLAKVRHAVRWK